MNRLADQSSPYLLQHKDNPVDWWPWCEEAFELARAEDKPIFLSIGYSSCHWCHVMAHESFEDTVTAEVLNSHFVPIKVDREERPDIDALYMESVQVLTGSGGWPLSVFLTPDGRPFYAGTYFPPRGTGRTTSFTGVLSALSNAWENRRQEVEKQADDISRAIAQKNEVEKTNFNIDIARGPDFLEAAALRLLENFDSVWGGFGSPPKFPQPALLELLLHHHITTRSQETLDAAVMTLDAMSSGGIYDHIGGGFARYSVDERWLVPHFEKMLYDQAQMAKIYAFGWAVTKNPNWLQVVTETVGYVLRELHEPGKGLFSSQDADSEGVEGKYYLFSAEEIKAILGSDAVEFIEHFGVTEKGNFDGSNILYLPRRGELSRSPSLEESRKKVLAARRNRVPPGLDDKVILEWNAMFVSALAQIGFLAGRDDWIRECEDLLKFLESNLLINGRWMRVWRAGTVSQPAFAADYAQLVDCYTRTYEATGKARYLESATEYAKELIDLFEDKEDGGFFTSGTDQEKLILRTKDLFDGATPSTNSVASHALARLSKLTDRGDFRDSSMRVIDLLDEGIAHHPGAFPLLVHTLSLLNGNSQEIVIPGYVVDLIAQLRGRWLPDTVIAFGEGLDSPLWKDREVGNAYICRGFSCLQPISQASELSIALDSLAETFF